MHEPFGSEHIPVKMYRGTNRLVVAAPMAGMEPENILVEVTADGQLSLHGLERAELKGEKDVLLDEWNPGPYHRRVELPDAVDANLANVTYSNGVLVVALPLSGETRPARLTLERIGPGRGERVASHGRPVHPTTAEEHHGAGGHGRG
jgi:HSP20 family protein